MQVRRRKRNGRTEYFMDYSIHGTRRREKLKVENKKDADAVAAVKWADIQRKIVYGEKAPTTGEKLLTVETLITRHIDRPDISESTRAMERRNSKPLLRIVGNDARVHDLSPARVEAYKKKRREDEKKAVRTVNMELCLLRAAINRAVDIGMLSKAPCPIEKMPEPRRDMKVLNKKQVLALLMECHAAGIADHVTVLANCGLRRSELFSLRWYDVDFDAGTLTVRTRKHGGAGEVRADIIPLNDVVLESLRDRRQSLEDGANDHALIFGIEPEQRNDRLATRRKGKKGQVDGVDCFIDHRFRHKLKKAAERAGIPWANELRPHDLRHYLATALLQHGTSIADTAKMLRHRTPSTTLSVYAHAMDSTLRGSLEKVAASAPAPVVQIGRNSESKAPERHHSEKDAPQSVDTPGLVASM